MNRFTIHAIKTCLNSTLDGRCLSAVKEPPAVNCKGGDGRTPKAAWKMWRRKTLFSGMRSRVVG